MQLLNFAETVVDTGQDLIFSLQPVNQNRDPLTLVLTDLTLAEVQEVAAIQAFNALIAAGVIEAGDVVPSKQDGIISEVSPSGRTNNDDGDDLLIGTPGVNTFFFDSRHGDNDEPEHVDVVIGFGSEDKLFFRIDGGFFENFAFKGNDNQATVGADDIDELGQYLMGKGGENAAFYDSVTNSTVLVIDDSPANANDNLTIVLFDAGNLL